jgi:hypothetical protein
MRTTHAQHRCSRSEELEWHGPEWSWGKCTVVGSQPALSDLVALCSGAGTRLIPIPPCGPTSHFQAPVQERAAPALFLPRVVSLLRHTVVVVQQQLPQPLPRLPPPRPVVVF